MFGKIYLGVAMKTKAARILVVEDSRASQILVRGILESHYELDFAESATQALEMAKALKYDLILLDLGLPDQDGFQLCAQLRQIDGTSKTPIFMVTGKAKDEDKMLGFQIGADDYIVKPFKAFELKARVHARLKWLDDQKAEDDIIRSGIFEAQLSSQRVYAVSGESKTEISLTALEFKLFKYLLNHPDHVLSRQQILNGVWGNEAYVSERTVDTHISKLRKKLLSFADCLHSVHGAGYRYDVRSHHSLSA